MNRADRSLRCGELAQLTGVSPDTIRHYERIGILPKAPRTPSGYRMYGAGAIERVRLIQGALRLGFTLSELSEVMTVRDGGGVPCHRVLSLAEAKLRALEHQIEGLRLTQHFMKELIRQWRVKLAHTRNGSRALLLESVEGTAPPSTLTSPNGFSRRKLS